LLVIGCVVPFLIGAMVFYEQQLVEYQLRQMAGRQLIRMGC
jgi:hypothetical protein